MQQQCLLSSSVVVAALMVLLVALATANGNPPPLPPQLSSSVAGPNITAGYECNDDCTQCNATGSMIPGGCTWVPPAHSYVMYTCIEDNTMVQLYAFGPLEILCSSKDPLHLTYKYPVDTCVSPPAGGKTIYHCPTSDKKHRRHILRGV